MTHKSKDYKISAVKYYLKGYYYMLYNDCYFRSIGSKLKAI